MVNKMQKYSEISEEINTSFKAGLDLLQEAVDGIEDLITLFKASSGKSIDSIISELETAKSKYNTVINTVKGRNKEISERAQSMDASLDVYIKKKENNEKIGTTRTKVTKVIESAGKNLTAGSTGEYAKYEDAFRIVDKYIGEIWGADSENGVACYRVKYRASQIGWIYHEANSYEINVVPGFEGLVGGLWNESECVPKLYTPLPQVDSSVDTVTAASVTKEKAISNMSEAEAAEYIRSNLNPAQWHVYQNSPPGMYSGMTPEEIVANFKGSSVSSLDEYF